MAIDIKNILENIIRVGRVSSTNATKSTVRVYWPDRDNMVSDDLLIINRGSLRVKDYWIPDIGEQVVCIMLPNGKNAGYCIGSIFSDDAPPQISNVNSRRLDFPDGTYIEYDKKSHNLTINCVGEIRINGKMIYLN